MLISIDQPIDFQSKLPPNPTQAQLRSVAQMIVAANFPGPVQVEGVQISGGKASGEFVGDGERYSYEITDGALTYDPIGR
ncbi:MAG: hypothetical protein EBZ77_03560 [Chitinophagia bacterium]|nr:hypothetical protein [Chitinophagia bacterium]